LPTARHAPHKRGGDLCGAGAMVAASVEIDPRLLRQLQEEYEALVNDTERESSCSWAHFG